MAPLAVRRRAILILDRLSGARQARITGKGALLSSQFFAREKVPRKARR